MNILMPIAITSISTCSIAEPDSTETEWITGGTYILGDLRIRVATHRVYQCILGHTARSALPEADPLYWKDYRPTLRWAPFDIYTTTAANSATSPMIYTLSPGYFNAMSLYGLVGSTVTITVKDAPAGATIDSRTISLYEESAGLYEYLFSEHTQKTKIVATGFPLTPLAEVTVSVAGVAPSMGMCNFGSMRTIDGDWGGTQYGASVEPITYSRMVTDPTTGETSIKRGPAASGLRANVVMPIAAANYAISILQSALDIPVSCIGTDMAGYEGLNVFGLISSVVTYGGPGYSNVSITVKGMI